MSIGRETETTKTMTDYNRAMDEAEAVKVSDDSRIIVVWHGGTTFNVFMRSHTTDIDLEEADVFNVSDEKGRPVSREKAIGHMEDYLEREA